MDVIVTIEAYKTHLAALGYAAATITLYRKGLDRFSRYLTERTITDVRMVTGAVIEDYRAQVMARPIAR